MQPISKGKPEMSEQEQPKKGDFWARKDLEERERKSRKMLFWYHMNSLES
jgi:hypothetical protein